MAIRALAFGAIGSVAETSDIQRQAFNLAFKQSGLDWVWDHATYLRLLERPGGARRIAEFAKLHGDLVDAVEVHSRKVANFRALVLDQGIAPRPGVWEMIAAARSVAMPVAWATDTGSETVRLMLDGLAGAIPRSTFSYVGDMSHVDERKPAPDIYLATALDLGVAPEQILAIEDTPESAEAALAAGCVTVGYPGVAARNRAFPAGCRVVERLSADLLELEVAA